MASTGSKTRPQPAASQLGLSTDPAPLLLLLLMSADDAMIFAVPGDMTATHKHSHTHISLLSIVRTCSVLKHITINTLNPLKPNVVIWLHLKCSANLPFLISDIRALWRSRLSAKVPECQKLTSSSAMAERPRELDQRFRWGVKLRLL